MTITAEAEPAACLACGATTSVPYLSVAEWTYRSCSRCSAAFLPRDELRDQRASHAGRSYKLARFLIESRNARHNQWLVNRLRAYCPTGTLLEVGCGSGFFLREAADAGFDVTGIDIGHENSVVGEALLGLTILSRDYLDFVWPTPFDAIVMHQLIEHVTDPAAFVRKSYALLKPGGILFLTTPNLTFARGLVAMFKMLGKPPPMNDALGHPPNHCVLFEPQTLRLLLERSQLEVLTMEHNPTGFRGQSSTVTSFLRRKADELALQLGRTGALPLMGPNFLCVARKPPESASPPL